MAAEPHRPVLASIPRTAIVVIGVLFLQVGFIASYVGGWHKPEARDIPFAVVAPAALQQASLAQLQKGGSLRVRVLPDEDTAVREIRKRSVYGALVVGGAGPTTDRLLIARAANFFVADGLIGPIQTQETGLRRTLQIRDVVRLTAEDPRGLSGFYLVIGWVVGGYLVATVLGLLRGTAAATQRAALARLSTLWLYSVGAGIGGTIVAQPLTGALRGHSVELALVGTLVVFAVAAATAAFIGALGVIGTGLAIILFVVLGNPSSGGAFAPEVLPSFWRVIGGYLPPGAGTQLVNRVIYFPDASVVGPVVVLLVYVAVGVAGTFLSARLSPHSLVMTESRGLAPVATD